MVQRQRESGSHRYRMRDVLGLSNTNCSACDEVANLRCNHHGNGNGNGNGDDHGHDGRAPRLDDGLGPTMHHHGSTIVDRSSSPLGDLLASTPARPRARARCIRTSGRSTVMGAPPPRHCQWATRSHWERALYSGALGRSTPKQRTSLSLPIDARPGRSTSETRDSYGPPRTNEQPISCRIGLRVSYDTRAPAVDRPPKAATERFYGSVWRRDHEKTRPKAASLTNISSKRSLRFGHYYCGGCS